MAKKVLILLLILTISMMLSSCQGYSVWEDMCNTYPDQMFKVQEVEDDEGNYCAKYEGKVYYVEKSYMFYIRDNGKVQEGDVLISWNSLPLGIWYMDCYYSDTADNPVFFYISRLSDVYLRSDYDYTLDTFVLDGTDNKFVFSDMLTPSDAFSHMLSMHYKGEVEVLLYSETYPRLQVPLLVFCADDVWFAASDCGTALFEVSDEFVDMLK